MQKLYAAVMQSMCFIFNLFYNFQKNGFKKTGNRCFVQVLKAHVIPGFIDRHEAIQLVALAQSDPAVVTTLHGTDLLATFFPNTLYLNIRTAGTDIELDFLELDIPVCSGVFHVVDKVLLPADLFKGGNGGSKWVTGWEAQDISGVLHAV